MREPNVNVEPPVALPAPAVAPGVRPMTWREARTPRWVAVGAQRLVVGFLAFTVLTAVAPWQQTAAGQGQVIAWAPEERQQVVEAPIGGRVERWFVGEGEHVVAGQVLARVLDNDPLLLDRLRSEQRLVEDQLRLARSKVIAGEAKVSAAHAARDASVAAAEAKAASTQEKARAEAGALLAAEASEETARVQLARMEALAAEGLRSTQEVENAKLRYDTAAAKVAEQGSKLAAAEQDLLSADGDLRKALAEGDGKLAVAEGELAAARSEVADYEGKLLGSETKVARQDNQDLIAPTGGIVARIVGGQGGEMVRQGDVLAVLVPDQSVRSAELLVDGNDARFVQAGDEVRLQFEGWPALQVSGWPAAAVGTWGATVAMVDPVGDSKGRFRVVVTPGPDGWPPSDLLRIGNRVNGWVLLGQVPLGWEVWRRLNDFPANDGPDDVDKGAGDPVERTKAGKAWKK
jgi:adhesin transport system membrane fusion protein